MVVKPERMGEIVSTSKKDLLPTNRSKLADDEFGYLEPEVIRPGRCSVRQALQFIGDHYVDSSTHTVTSISKQYNLDKESVERVIKYFHVFNVQMPLNKREESGIMKALTPGFFRRTSTPVESGKTDKTIERRDKNVDTIENK